MKVLLIIAALALPLAAQQRFTATTGDVTLTAASTALTLQKPASGRNVALESAQVYCSAACSVTQAYDGVAATTTAGSAAVAPPSNGTVASTTVFTASNVGSGTAVGGIVHIPAGQTVLIDVSQIRLSGGATPNYTLTIASMTGTANITITWKENQ